ncbi:hypothetical protein NE237_028528 [Protea cynaroides]|uniref:Uncharacterized protein n=1 Tax=Protea cynaroides TaxID=273540 RepID=A0A9Q0GPJ2_9MAGN|nr:hypothetical protein NE237_028528 [Protea cynaroides]
MLERDRIMDIPAKQRMERQQGLAKEKSDEYKAALKRALTLVVPYAYSSSPYGTFDKQEDSSSTSGEASCETSRKRRRKESWDDFIGRLFDKDESGLKKSQARDGKQLRTKEVEQEAITQFDRSMQVSRIDLSHVIQPSWRPMLGH